MKFVIGIILIMFSCKGNGKTERFKDRNIISGSLTIKDNLLIYATWDNEIVIEDLTGKMTKFKTLNNCYAKPVLIKDQLFFPLSDSVFTCLDIKTSQTLWSFNLGGRCNKFYIIDDSIIIDAKHFGFIGLDKNTGGRKYELLYQYNSNCLLPDLSPYRITYNNELFFICDWQCNNLSAFQISNGSLKWKKSFRQSTSNVIAVNGLLFFGENEDYKGGEIMLLNASNGQIVHHQNSLFEQNFNPVLYNNKIYFYTYDSKLNEFDLLDNKTKTVYSFKKENDVAGSQMFLSGDHLYYSAQNNIYEISLKDFSVNILSNDVNDISGVIRKNTGIEFIY